MAHKESPSGLDIRCPKETERLGRIAHDTLCGIKHHADVFLHWNNRQRIRIGRRQDRHTEDVPIGMTYLICSMADETIS